MPVLLEIYTDHATENESYHIMNSQSPFSMWEGEIEKYQRVFAYVTIWYMPFIIVNNSLIIWGIILHPAFQSPSDYLLLSLAFADFSMGIFTIPMYFLSYTRRDLVFCNKVLCLTWIISHQISTGGSLYHLLFIALDRYVAVVFPLKYRPTITMERTKKFLAVLWIYILMLSIVPIFGWNHYNNSQPDGMQRCDFFTILPKVYLLWIHGSIVICIVVPLFIYINILIIVRNQIKNCRQQFPQWSKEQTLLFRTRVSSIKITASLVFAFIILWMPYSITYFVKYTEFYSLGRVEIILTVTQYFTFANAVVNAPIYAAGRSEYRQVFKVMLTSLPWKWKTHLRANFTERMSALYTPSVTYRRGSKGSSVETAPHV